MIPAILPRAIEGTYDGPKPEALLRREVSVTSLGGPPRIAVLMARNASRIPPARPEDRLAAFIGTAAHAAIASSAKPGEIVEERLKVMIGAWIISGQADLYEPASETLSDWKFCLALALKFGNKPDWIFQLRALSYIWRENGRKVSRLRDVQVGIDWRVEKALQDASYPQEPWRVHDVPVPPLEEVREELIGRLDSLSRALDVLPECTDEERWLRRDRKTGKTIAGRCARYCQARDFCSQYQESIDSRA